MTVSDAFVLPVDKPEGPTSHDIVAAARRGLGQRRVGHTGTLDPFASGLLVLCVGSATRLAEYLSSLDKSYEATARLGVSTDTLDLEGEVVSESAAWRSLAERDVEAGLAALAGETEQRPPQYSAKKVEGVAMHRRARRGEVVALQPCPVTIHSIEVVGVDLPHVSFRVRCSSGTYVRAIARDLGDALGVGAHLTRLRRTAVGAFDVTGAIGVDDLSDASAVTRARIDPLRAMAHLPAIEIDEAAATRIGHGQRLRLEQPVPAGLVLVSSGGALLAVAEVEGGVLRPRKVLG